MNDKMSKLTKGSLYYVCWGYNCDALIGASSEDEALKHWRAKFNLEEDQQPSGIVQTKGAYKPGVLVWSNPKESV